MRGIIATLAILVPAVALAGEPVGIEVWDHNHPEAARELGEWVKNHPEAAHQFFEWDGHHPVRAKEFVTWSITHPAANIDVFVVTHRGWEYFDVIMEKHRPAAEAFLAWTRRHPKAAEQLMNHPKGLEWAGNNLYKEFWQLEHPNAQPAAPEAGMEVWDRNHPEAAKELGEWVKHHPEAARLFFEWDGHHTGRAKDFVTWAITHPGDNIDVFVLAHPGWERFDKIMEHHRPAAEAFIAWCRKHPKAAEALMNHPRGLEWAGNHLYKEHWDLEHPRH